MAVNPASPVGIAPSLYSFPKLSSKLKPPRNRGNLKVCATAKTPGGTWIREGDGDEPVNFLDPQVVKRVVGGFGLAHTRFCPHRLAVVDASQLPLT